MCRYVFVVFVFFVVSCLPSRDATVLIDGRSVDGSITAKEAMRELDRNSVDPIMIYGEKVVVYVASDGKTSRYSVLGGRDDIERFLKKAEGKRVPIHVIQGNTMERYLNITIIIVVGFAALGIVCALVMRKKKRL